MRPITADCTPVLGPLWGPDPSASPPLGDRAPLASDPSTAEDSRRTTGRASSAGPSLVNLSGSGRPGGSQGDKRTPQSRHRASINLCDQSTIEIRAHAQARRAEKAFLAEWDRTRVKRQPRHIGLDEIQRGKGQRFWTVLSYVVHGEVIGLRQDRSEATAMALLTEDLTARQRGAITAVCTDMHRPYLNAVGTVLSKAEIVFDKFHVLQHASAALDDVRRQEFFRAGAVMREHGRGKRWLLLRRWKTVRGSKRRELQTLFAANRRLFKAYVLREQLDRLWTYKTRPGVLNFLNGWINALRWQRLPEMDRLGEFLFRHIEGIAAYCDHLVRFGVVESINTTIKAVLRRARGMRDEQMLLLKLKWTTAHPIRSARDLAAFLTAQPLYSNR